MRSFSLLFLFRAQENVDERTCKRVFNEFLVDRVGLRRCRGNLPIKNIHFSSFLYGETRPRSRSDLNWIRADQRKCVQNSLSDKKQRFPPFPPKKRREKPPMMNKYLAFKCLLAITRQTSFECVAGYAYLSILRRCLHVSSPFLGCCFLAERR